MNRKILFFDIDGTVISEHTKEVPKSTINAIIKAKKLGHLTFINTGRTICSIPDQVRQIPFDGYLCGCGTYITCQDQILFSAAIDKERGQEIIRLMNQYSIDGILEGSEDVYFKETPSRFQELNRIKTSFAHRNLGVTKYWEDEDFIYDKFVVFSDNKSDTYNFFKAIEKDMDIIDRTNGFYECVPISYSKATCIQFILKRFQLSLKDAYVFGDSSNDLPMFQMVPNGIAMEKHDPILDPYVTFVTKTVESDGIEFAMNHLGII